MKPPYKHRWIRLGLLCLSLSTALWPTDSSATDASFNLNGVVLTLTEAGADAGVHFQSMRLNRAQNVWNVEVWVTNRSVRVLQGPLVLRVDSFSGTTGPLQADGVDNNSRPYYDLSSSVPGGMLLPGQKSNPRTLALGVAAGAPQMAAAVFVMPSLSTGPAGLVRTLDEVGQPLTSVVAVDEKSGITNRTDDTFGVATLSGKAGDHVWRFDRSGYYPVWRAQALVTDRVVVVPSPRLTPRGTNSALATPIGGGLVADAASAMQIRLPPGAFSQEVRLLLTPLTGQSLPALLPQGWSPLQAFWLDCEKEPAIPATAGLQPWGAISAGEVAALVKWNGAELRWETVQVVTGKGTDPLTVSLPGSGAYALVIADPGAIAPPAAAVGSPLSASSVRLPDPGSLSADGRVEPNSSPASRQPELVTAQATVIISNASGALPSGLLLRGVVNEVYSLRNGAKRPTPQYENFLVGYQRPGDGLIATLTATFPIRPQLLYGAEELDTARVQVEVVAPEAFAGGLLDEAGGQVAAGGLRILAGAGDLSGVGAIQTRWLEASNYVAVFGGALSVIRAFDLITGAVSPGRKLVAQFDGLPTNLTFVLAKVLSRGGWYGLEPRERLRTDVQGRLASLEPATQPRLDGITGPGQYLLIQVAAAQGLITGVVRNSAGQPAGGWPVSLSGLPWLTFSDPNGAYRLVAGTGPVQVAVSDLATGDRGQASTSLTNSQVATTADVGVAAVGPVASLLTPTNGATAVARVSRVVVAFSRPIAPGSLLNGGVRLLARDNSTVTATLTLSLDNTTATLLPTDPLAPNTFFTVLLSTNIADTTGRPLVGNSSFTFKTQNNALDRAGAQLISYEPTNGLAPIFGTPGTADPESPVLLVNETSGGTATILSRPDGSFTNVIAAGVDDFLSAVLVNQNGTRTTIPVSRQVFQDGSVGLFNGGGLLEAQSDGGPVQVLVDPGAIAGKTRFQLSVLPLSELLPLLKGVSPEGGKVLGGFQIAQEGDDPQNELHVSFPVNPAALGLPAGTLPENQTYALTMPREIDGVLSYQIINQMYYENGRLVTHSPPFPGVQIRSLLQNSLESYHHDTLQESIGSYLAQTPFSKVFSAPVMLLTQGNFVLQGRVVSQPLNTTPHATHPETPIQGAVVSVTTDGAVQNKRGRLDPGQYSAITDEKGEFALLVPLQTAQGAGFVAQATHPRFPNQVAVATLTRAGGTEIYKAGISLRFTTIDPTTIQTPDVLGPRLTISHLPNDPTPGSGLDSGAVIRVTAIDDRDVASLTLSVLFSQPLGAAQPALTVEGPDPITTSNLRSTGLEKTFRLLANRRSRVTVRAQAADSAGNLTVADYDLIFDGNQPPPPPIGDTNGLRVVFCWPPNGATSVKPQEPILLRFSKPPRINSETTIQNWLTFSSGHKPVSATVSADGREVSINYSGPASGPVSLSVNGQLTDQGGYGLDMDPVTPGKQSFNLNFELAGSSSVSFPGVASGGGIALKGAYAYLLDRETGHGWLKIFSLIDPAAPVLVGSLELPDYPRAIEMIPRWRYKLRPEAAPLENDLVAVAGGLVSSTDGGGNAEGQYLWIIDISDPTHPQKLVSSILSYDISTVNKLKWFAPHLAYLECGADNSSVGLINLQSYLIGMKATRAEADQFPANGLDGVDKDGDGDYVGPNDQLPLPAKNGAGFFGLEYTYASPASQYIMDFDVEPAKALLGVVLRPQGGSSAEPGRYVTLYAGTRFLDPASSGYPLAAGMVPRRVSILSGVLMENSGDRRIRDLALVSVEGTPSELQVIDISDPLAPALLKRILIPRQLGSQSYDFGNIQSIQRRADGLIALAALNDVLLIDLRRLLDQPLVPGGISPALVGIIPGSGSGGRSFVADTTGLNLVNLGGKHSLVRTAPFLDIVSFASTPPFSPASLLTLSDREKAALWRGQSSPDLLLKATLQINGTQATPPPAVAHYYVRLDAPGGAGPSLKLSLETLNAAGAPLFPTPPEGLPVRLATVSTLNALNDTNLTSFPRTLECRRLSDDPRSEFYNNYLSAPVLITGQSPTAAQLRTLLSFEPAGLALMRADKFAWAAVDPQMITNRVVGNYAARVANQRLLGGTPVRKPVERPRLPLVVVPGVAGSRLGTGGDADDDWLTICRSVKDVDLNGGNPAVYATAILRSVVLNAQVLGVGPTIPVMQVYGPLLDELIRRGYVPYDDHKKKEERTLAGALASQAANGPNLFVFPYDWRRDNKQTAAELAEFVQVALRYNPDAEAVDVLAHSMGGMVSRRFIIDQTTNRVRKFISVDTPYLGAPKFINVMQTGDFAPIAWLENSLMRRAVRFFTGPHQLAPSLYYFQAAGTNNPMSEYGWDVDKNGTAYGGPFTYSQFKNTFDNVLLPYSHPITANEIFHTYVSASGNHQTIWTNDTTGVQNYHIYGVQKSIQTLGGVRHVDRTRSLKQCNNLAIDLAEKSLNEAESLLAHPTNDYSRAGIFRGVNHEVELTYVRGDGTVPEISETRKSGNLDFNDPRAKTWTYYSDSTEYDADQLADHNGILKNPNTYETIAAFIEGIEPTNARPNWGPVTMYSVRLSDVEPKTLIGYDQDGGTSAPPLPSSHCAGTVFNGKFKNFAPNGQGGFEVLMPGDRTSTVEFKTPSRPFNIVILKHVEGLIEERIVYKDVLAPPDFDFLVRVNSDGTVEAGLGHGSAATIFPYGQPVILTGDAARDSVPPTITQRLDGSVVRFTATDNSGRPARLFLVHDTNGDGDCSDETHELLPDGTVSTIRIAGEGFYVRAEDQALNLSKQVRVIGGVTPPASVCKSAEYSPLGVGLATQTETLEGFVNRALPVADYITLTNAGIPLFEGYELALLSEAMALKSGCLLRIVNMTGSTPPDPAKRVFTSLLRTQLAQVGQATVRAAVALFIGTPDMQPNLAGTLFLSPDGFSQYGSFERFVVERVRTANSLFSPAELTLLDQAAKAAVCDAETFARLLGDDCAANTFLGNAMVFIRRVQSAILTDYNVAMQLLDTPGQPLYDHGQFVVRNANRQRLLNGTAAQTDGLNILQHFVGLDLVARVFNRGSNSVDNVVVRMFLDKNAVPPYQEVPIAHLKPDQVLYIAGNSQSQPLKAFSLLLEVPGSGTALRSAYLIVDPDGSVSETDKEDNWFGFQFYILDIDHPCLTDVPPGLSPPSSRLLEFTPICQ